MSTEETPTGFTYKTDFSDKYFVIFKEILEKTTADGTPYALTKNFIADQVKELTLKPREQAEIISAMMANITIGITAQAMQTARVITMQNFRHEADMKILSNNVKKSDTEIEIVTSTKGYKIGISQEQLNKLKKEIEYLTIQIAELPKATKNNNNIQALRESAQMIGTIIAADSVPTTEMIKQIYAIIKSLTTLEAPTSIKVDKAT